MLTIINKSQKIFDGLIFTRIEDQSHGESDYIDNKGQLYDAKLLFDKKQGALIGDPKNDFKDWLQAVLDEKTEFGESIGTVYLSKSTAFEDKYSIIRCVRGTVLWHVLYSMEEMGAGEG